MKSIIGYYIVSGEKLFKIVDEVLGSPGYYIVTDDNRYETIVHIDDMKHEPLFLTEKEAVLYLRRE